MLVSSVHHENYLESSISFIVIVLIITVNTFLLAIMLFIILIVNGIRAVVLGLSCLLDQLMYGSWVIVPLNFLKFNFFSSGGDYYGTHKWHWYFSQGFSVMLFTFIPFSLVGSMKSKCWKFSGLIAWVLIF